MNDLFGQPEPASADAETTKDESSSSEASIQPAAVEPEVPALEKLSADVCSLKEIVLTMQARLTDVETALDTTAKQVAFLPPQMRLLGNKIDGAAVSLSEPRYRSVLLNLLGLYDLFDQMSRALPVTSDDQTGADHYRNYEILRTQLCQILEANGLSQIETSGAFNPELHRAVQRVSCNDPAQSGQVIEVVRVGFRTEQAVLRYAEVIVGQYLLPKNEIGEDREADRFTTDTSV